MKAEEDYIKEWSIIKYKGELPWNNTDIKCMLKQYAELRIQQERERIRKILESSKHECLNCGASIEIVTKPKSNQE